MCPACNNYKVESYCDTICQVTYGIALKYKLTKYEALNIKECLHTIITMHKLKTPLTVQVLMSKKKIKRELLELVFEDKDEGKNIARNKRIKTKRNKLIIMERELDNRINALRQRIISLPTQKQINAYETLVKLGYNDDIILDKITTNH